MLRNETKFIYVDYNYNPNLKSCNDIKLVSKPINLGRICVYEIGQLPNIKIKWLIIWFDWKFEFIIIS